MCDEFLCIFVCDEARFVRLRAFDNSSTLSFARIRIFFVYVLLVCFVLLLLDSIVCVYLYLFY